jgi:hypothetical protein
MSDIIPRDRVDGKCEDGRMIVSMDITKPEVGLNWHRIEFVANVGRNSGKKVKQSHYRP